MPDSELDEKAARVLNRAEQANQKLIRRRAALEWAEKRSAAIEGTATSADGRIRATVDSTGLLTALELPVPLSTPPSALGPVITATVRKAAAQARDQVRATYTGLRNEGTIPALPGHLLPAPAVAEAPQPARCVRQRPVEADPGEGPPESWLERRPW
ncbi:YbaB/EbfC family nucleoid-associated protein [Sciscionella sediminilitoris]|uniref:YbaB/EbfC family nucleoid-associated protein n=1 Tax=Sciscionella sediminilitoris TaxID=1445613 RepID=UPI000691907F|nr:YbaB/EbfC family nucleoid-associated protein [Sciscionella sp. SE31]